MVLDGQLVMIDPNEPNPKESLSILEPVAGQPHQFRVGKTSDAQLQGESVAFEMEPGAQTAKSVKDWGSCDTVALDFRAFCG
jgi:hypothetical protein